MNLTKEAVTLFEDGYNCSQAIFSSYAQQLGLDLNTALKIAAPLGAGMGRTGNVCGAVSGALLVIGLKFGYTSPVERETKEKVYALVREFTAQFCSRNGSICCPDLLGQDIGTPEGRRAAEEQKLFSAICPKLIRDSSEILSDLLNIS